ncbi:MAG: type IV pilus assembly protein PilM [Candidatus Doudnabacteria bacterium]|nr:type IV pilus assembly protein PilM [Candidatus Doudnabacteria bacterium]
MFFESKKNVLGVDIGTSNIKIAEVFFANPHTAVLSSYGIVNSPYQLSGKNDSANIPQIGLVLKNLCSKAGVSTKRCVISLPNSSVFTSIIELPQMSSKELATAVEFEAKKYVPLDLTDVDLSWSPIGGQEANEGNQKILLTAVPKQITKDYMEIFAQAGLEPFVGEIEALALIRTLIGNKPISCVIIDIGAKSTGLNIIEKGLLRLSRNLNIGGETITKKIAQTLNISFLRAEQFKKDFGVQSGTFLPETIRPVLGLIKSEVKQLLTIFQSHSAQLDEIILVGGGANLPGIVDFFSDLNVPVSLGNPLQAVAYSTQVSEILSRYALNLPIAIGLALRRE